MTKSMGILSAALFSLMLLCAPALAQFADTLPQPTISDVSNAPNPFDSRKPGLEGQTQISYTLAHDAAVRVVLYDLLGFRVKRWDFRAGQEGARAGVNRLMWDATNELGQKVSKGGYIAQIEVESPQGFASAFRKIGVIH